jgi:uncharacterized coiled-coil DUF342 family protein
MRTVEELEALLEVATRERDDAHARWVAIINGRGTTISDVETLTNDLNTALSQRDKVRVELREARILTQEIGDVCRGKQAPSKKALILLGPLLRERDEARAYAEDRNDEANKLQRLLNMAATERDEARAEVQRLTDELDELLVRVADQGAELRATREAYNGARTDVPALIARVRELEAERDAYARSYLILKAIHGALTDALPSTPIPALDSFDVVEMVRALATECAKWKAAFENIRLKNTDLMMELFEAQEKARAVNTGPVLHENEQLRSHARAVSNLLAIIHGDGGHYEGKHGTVKACRDAEGVVSDLRLKLDAATYALGEKP